MKIRTQLLVFILSVVFLGFLSVILLSYKSSREIVSSEVYAHDGQFVIRQKFALETEVMEVVLGFLEQIQE